MFDKMKTIFRERDRIYFLEISPCDPLKYKINGQIYVYCIQYVYGIIHRFKMDKLIKGLALKAPRKNASENDVC